VEDNLMETYMLFGNWTEKGIAALKETPARIAAARKSFQDVGGRIIGWWALTGQYDFVVIVEVPAEVGAMRMVFQALRQGNFRTVTTRAYSEEEFAEALKALP
jgi:uncharacterized protein with GYD domain